MAATTELSEKIDRYLRRARARIEALPRVEQRWTASETSVAPDQQRVDRNDFRYEWGDSMDRLAWLDEAYERQAMSDEQAARYAVLLPVIRSGLPIIERLGLDLPPEAVLKRLSADDRLAG